MKFSIWEKVAIGAITFIAVHHIRAYFHRRPKKTIQVNGKRVNYEINQLGDPMVILVSGANMSGTCMLPLQRKLSKYGISSLIYDRLGTGKSDKPDSMSFKVFAQHIVEFVQLVDNKSIILIGHSFGGVAVQLYTQLYNVDPRIKSIILVEPTPADYIVKLPGVQEKFTAMLQPRFITMASFLGDLGILRFFSDLLYLPFYFTTDYNFYESARFYSDFVDGYNIRKLSTEFSSVRAMFEEGAEFISKWKPVSIKTTMVAGSGENPICSKEEVSMFFEKTSARLNSELLVDPSKNHFSILYSDLLFEVILRNQQSV
ncbi:hypothetical protein HDV06_005385 [Boothiomyces sp. JEL0866]|nr:hypothetical protein HDV06_005385 [Boothiomyces sp. JEL0866]